MFMIDLDEIQSLSKKLSFLSYNKFNIFSFHDKDHFKKADSENDSQTTKDKLGEFLLEKGIHKTPSKIKLLTHFRIFGYVFNPVSFYYCYDESERVFCIIAEVSNTYGEMKMYLLQNLEGPYFKETHQKLFYISPFTELDDYLRLKVGLPSEQIKIYIDDFDESEVKVKTALTGTERALTDKALLKYVLRFPLITIQIISLIHWQALKLWLKGVRFISKSESLNLQKDIYFKKNTTPNGTFPLREDRFKLIEENEAGKTTVYR